jgi:hypothetical protein
MITPPVSGRRKHVVTKKLATGFSKGRNSGVGLNKQIRNISGATEFVCGFLPDPRNTIIRFVLTFAPSKLAVEKLYSRMNSPSLQESRSSLSSNYNLRGYIIDHLRKSFPPATDDTVIIYYFFDFSNKMTLRASTFLRCILHQAIRSESLLPNQQRRLESVFIDQIDQAEPDTRELLSLFVEFYEKFKNSFLIIDGLDQAEKSHQRIIISFIKEIQKLSCARILVTTYPDIDMSKVLSHSQKLQISPEDLEGDIEIFVQRQIDEHSQMELSVCSPSLLGKLKQALISGAEEMLVRS